jgi:hypothetical protein
MAKQYGFSVKSIVLVADKDELLQRNAHREYSVPTEEFESLYSNIYQTIDPSETVVGSTGQTAEDTLAELKALI